jgi:hypothetical protein
MVQWARTAVRSDWSAIGIGVGWGVIWSVVSIAATAMTTDPWYVLDYRFLTYFLLALLWQRKEALRPGEMEPAEISYGEPYGQMAYSASEYG